MPISVQLRAESAIRMTDMDLHLDPPGTATVANQPGTPDLTRRPASQALLAGRESAEQRASGGGAPGT